MRVGDLQVFLTVAELGSITATGKQLNLSSSAASIAIKRLEQNLGTELFVRTTRQLR
ncbi:LysR family transcriptional regulator [Marinomonas epiphytica]